jgi:hypothetical protein
MGATADLVAAVGAAVEARLAGVWTALDGSDPVDAAATPAVVVRWSRTVPQPNAPVPARLVTLALTVLPAAGLGSQAEANARDATEAVLDALARFTPPMTDYTAATTTSPVGGADQPAADLVATFTVPTC